MTVCSNLLIKFAVNLEGGSGAFIRSPKGPLFHRWLPEGEKDSISFVTGYPYAKLKAWFERRGFMDGGFITYDTNRREVDETVIPQQAVLDGGPLRGTIEFTGGISSEEMHAVLNNKIGDPAYVGLAKRVVLFIFPHITRLISILRVQFGQYWLRELPAWDSRRESLGGYCASRLFMHWSADDGAAWHPFQPDESRTTITVELRTAGAAYADYMTSEDWAILKSLLESGFEPTLASHLLSRAYESLEDGDVKNGFVEGITALEVALSKIIKDRSNAVPSLEKDIDFVFSLRLSQRVALIPLLMPHMSMSDLPLVVKALKLRHAIVHDGLVPSDADTKILVALLKFTAQLVPGPHMKFPSANSGNSIKPVAEWEKNK